MYICYNTLPDVKESGFQNPENFYLYVESEMTPKNFARRLRNPGRGVQNPNYWIPLRGAKHQRILSPESWTCSASLVFVLV